MTYSHQPHLYSHAAKQYADPSIRPRYPPELFERVFRFCEQHRDSALDVATGSGQSARELAKEFRQVYAIDTSEEQLQHAESVPNVHYGVGSAEKTGRPDGSIDLITVATALHWFDIPVFYKEARRVLKPHGALAAWTYVLPEVKGNKAASQVVDNLFRNTLKPYLEEAHHIFFANYNGNEPTASDFLTVERDSLDFEQPSSVEKLVQFLCTTGMYAKLEKADSKKAQAVAERFQEDLLEAADISGAHAPLTLVWRTFLLLAKHPLPLKPNQSS